MKRILILAFFAFPFVGRIGAAPLGAYLVNDSGYDIFITSFSYSCLGIHGAWSGYQQGDSGGGGTWYKNSHYCNVTAGVDDCDNITPTEWQYSYNYTGSWNDNPAVIVNGSLVVTFTCCQCPYVAYMSKGVQVITAPVFLQNKTTSPQTYEYKDNENPSAPPVDITLQPGQMISTNLSFKADPNGNPNVSWTTFNPTYLDSFDNTNYMNLSTNLGGMDQTTTNRTVNQNFYQTNGLIYWNSPSTNPAGGNLVFDATVNATLQAGFNRVAQDATDLKTLLAKGNGLLAGMSNTGHVQVNVSNNLSGLQVTNNLTLNYPTNGNISLSNYASESTLRGISNLLGGVFTNGFSGTNYSGEVTNGNYVYGGFTNYSDAASVSVPFYDQVLSTFSGLIGSIVIPEVGEGGECDPMILDFSGSGFSFGHIDFNPLHNDGIAAIFYYAKELIKWFLCIYYVGKLLKDSRWAISVCNQSHGTMNPASVKQR